MIYCPYFPHFHKTTTGICHFVVLKMYQCEWEECELIFTKPSRLEAHMRIHTGEKPFKCSYVGCTARYARNQHLQRHIIIQHKRPNSNSPGRSDTRRKRDCFECQYEGCSAVFHKRKQLHNHTLRHKVILSYRCTEEGCSMAFETPSKLKRHTRMHEGYDCPRSGCQETLRTWTALLKHVRESHPKEYRCSNCSQVFASSALLRRHSQSHSSSKLGFACPHCDRNYVKKSSLQQHIRAVHEGLRFKCVHDGCDSSFSTKQRLEIHRKTHSTDQTKTLRMRSKIRSTDPTKTPRDVKPKPVKVISQQVKKKRCSKPSTEQCSQEILTSVLSSGAAQWSEGMRSLIANDMVKLESSSECEPEDADKKDMSVALNLIKHLVADRKPAVDSPSTDNFANLKKHIARDNSSAVNLTCLQQNSAEDTRSTDGSSNLALNGNGYLHSNSNIQVDLEQNSSEADDCLCLSSASSAYPQGDIQFIEDVRNFQLDSNDNSQADIQFTGGFSTLRDSQNSQRGHPCKENSSLQQNSGRCSQGDVQCTEGFSNLQLASGSNNHFADGNFLLPLESSKSLGRDFQPVEVFSNPQSESRDSLLQSGLYTETALISP